MFQYFISYGLGLIFILSGLAKIFSLDSFAVEIAQYAESYIGQWAVANRFLVALCVCFSEIAVGVLAFCGKYMKIASFLMLFALSFFLYLTGMNYFFPPVTGSIEACGCFGEIIHFSPIASFFKSIILWLMACLNIFVLLQSRHSAWHRIKIK